MMILILMREQIYDGRYHCHAIYERWQGETLRKKGLDYI